MLAVSGIDNAEGMSVCTYEGGIKTGRNDYDLARKTSPAVYKLRKITGLYEILDPLSIPKKRFYTYLVAKIIKAV